ISGRWCPEIVPGRQSTGRGDLACHTPLAGWAPPSPPAPLGAEPFLARGEGPMPTRRTRTTWCTAEGIELRLVAPPPDHPDLLAWWRPVHRASRAAGRPGQPAPLRLDDFDLVGSVPRQGRPNVWAYRHRGSGRELFADIDGGTYQLQRRRS